MSSVVYFIRDASGAIKIGRTKDILHRLRQFSTGHASELILLGVMDGDERTEKRVHKRFLKHRIRGEWFAAVPELLQFIDDHALPFFQQELSLRARERDHTLISVADKLVELAGPQQQHDTVARKVKRVAESLGWSLTRTRDVWYCDPRVNISAQELAQVDAAISNSPATKSRENLEERVAKLEAHVFGMARGQDRTVGE
jgi:hypothetical protein